MNYQYYSNKKYSKLVRKKGKSLTEISGRYPEDKGSEKHIFIDIVKKLNLKKKETILDIGCGYGNLVKKIIKLSNKKNIQLTLCDIKKIISAIKSNIKTKENIKFVEQNFQNYNFKNLKYDKILIYSVIHYIDKPKLFLNKAFKLLKKDGSILIGDLPNIDKKYRFLKSSFGRKFEKDRIKRFDINKLTKSYNSFLKNTKQNLKINDNFIKWIKKTFSKKKAKVLILKQPNKLPYFYTREDILIKK